MLFWNNDTKAVVVVGTSIADKELQPEYTMGIFPILRTPYRWGGGGTFKNNLQACMGTFSIDSRALIPHSSEP